MNNELKIEYYLLQLDRELRVLPISQKADIITEIKSHISAVLEKDPQRPLDTILADLGSPKVVAERYLASKGITPAPAPKTGSWLKWLAVGTVAFFGFIFLSGLATIWYLSPIIKVDGNNGRVVLLGGLIDVDKDIGKVKLGGIQIGDSLSESVNVKGEADLTGRHVTMIKIPFNTAKLEVHPAVGQLLTWDCKAPVNNAQLANVVAGILTLDLETLKMAKCVIGLPLGSASEFTGVNGHMEVEKPTDNLNISLTNGKVNIRPDPARRYDFDVTVKNGLQDFFPHSQAQGAVKVKVDVVNGLVKKD